METTCNDKQLNAFFAGFGGGGDNDHLLRVTYSLFFDYVNRNWSVFNENSKTRKLSLLLNELKEALKETVKYASRGLTSDGAFADTFYPVLCFVKRNPSSLNHENLRTRSLIDINMTLLKAAQRNLAYEVKSR